MDLVKAEAVANRIEDRNGLSRGIVQSSRVDHAYTTHTLVPRSMRVTMKDIVNLERVKV